VIATPGRPCVVLPPGYQELPRDLAAVDALLDDPVFFAPYWGHFCPLWVRRSIRIEGRPVVRGTRAEPDQR